MENRLGRYEVQTENYSYHAQVNGSGRLRRLSEIDADGRSHRLSLRRLGRSENAGGGSAFSGTDDDEPTAPREYQDRGISARGEDCDDDNAGPSMPQRYGNRGVRVRWDEYEGDDDHEGPSTLRANSGRRMNSRRVYDDEDS